MGWGLHRIPPHHLLLFACPHEGYGRGDCSFLNAFCLLDVHSIEAGWGGGGGGGDLHLDANRLLKCWGCLAPTKLSRISQGCGQRRRAARNRNMLSKSMERQRLHRHCNHTVLCSQILHPAHAGVGSICRVQSFKMGQFA